MLNSISVIVARCSWSRRTNSFMERTMKTETFLSIDDARAFAEKFRGKEFKDKELKITIQDSCNGYRWISMHNGEFEFIPPYMELLA